MESRKNLKSVLLLLGLNDPKSPLSVLDLSVFQTIMCLTRPVRSLETKTYLRTDSNLLGPQPCYKEVFRDKTSGLKHNTDDDPAVVIYFVTQEVIDKQESFVFTEGIKKWYTFGKLNRGEDKPAKESTHYSSGGFTEVWRSEWYRDGVLHRDGDKPAMIDGKSCWYYKDGKLHRDDDKPAVVEIFLYRKWHNHQNGCEAKCPCQDGALEWWSEGIRHRDGDKPAVIYPDGMRKWYTNGKLHRGWCKPAIIHSDGKREWWRNGVRCSRWSYLVCMFREKFARIYKF